MKELLEKHLGSEIVVRMNGLDANNLYTLIGVGDDYFTVRQNQPISEAETLHVPYTSIFKIVESGSEFIIELNDTTTIASFTVNAYGELAAISKRLAEVEGELESLKKNSDSIKSTVDNIQSSIRFI